MKFPKELGDTDIVSRSISPSREGIINKASSTGGL